MQVKKDSERLTEINAPYCNIVPFSRKESELSAPQEASKKRLKKYRWRNNAGERADSAKQRLLQHLK